MVKSKIISLTAALMLILTLFAAPLLSLNTQASSLAEIFEDTKTRTSVYKVALLDADKFDSEDGCLTEAEESRLLSLMQETANSIKCNIGIVITSDLKKMSDERYIRNFHATVLGEYTDSISLMLLNTHNNPAYTRYVDQIYYTDRGYDLFHKKLDNIFDNVYKALERDDDDFYGACANFCASLKNYGTGFGAFLTKFNISGTLVLVMIIGGTVMSLIIVKSFTSGYKRKTPISAAHYIDKSRTRTIRQVDQFVREYTTSVHIQSSSGGSHGGGGGGHRSGGGGGRHR